MIIATSIKQFPGMNAKSVVNQYSKESIDQLKENEKRYRAFLIATTDVIYSMNPDWSIMPMLDGKGFLTDSNEPSKNWAEKYIHPDDKEFVKKAIDEAIQNKTIFQLEHRVLKADKSTGWIFSRAVPIIDEAGNIAEWIGTATDITEKKNIETSLAETRNDLERNQRLYEAITGSTPDLVYVFNLNYRFVYANKALLTMWGITEDEARGKSLLEVGYEPWHAEMHEREIDEVVATKKMIRGEVSFPHATLGRRMYDYIFAPVFNYLGDVVAIAGTTRDISDLKMVEETLKETEEQFRTLTQSLPQLIWTANTDGYCDFFNRRWYDYTGSRQEDYIENIWALFVHPKHQQIIAHKWKHSLETGEPMVAEFQLRAKDGRYNWFYILVNSIKDENDNIKKWVGALTNIEEQKAVEERLEKLVNERTKELQRSNSDLMQFAHVASHDLKEPLRKVKTFAKFLENELGNNLSEKSVLYLDKINSAIKRMDNMIEGVLNYSTLSNLENTFDSVNLRDVISNIQNDLELVIQQKKAIIEFDELPTLTGSPVLLYQLFYNLINNSLKFSQQDVQPKISIKYSEIEEKEKPCIKIIVKDNGIGFEADEAEAIFETFTRLNPKAKYEGTGLGLALCKKIVERHHGSITAKGKENEGAEFTILLPKE